MLSRYRGHWYERLSLDLDSHLHQPREALAACEAGLDDPWVRGGRRLMLANRVIKICKAKKAKLEEQLERIQERPDWDCPTMDSLPTVTLQGRLVSKKDGQAGGKSVFQVVHDNGDIQFCSVEELVKLHYSKLGLGEGIHAEGALFNSLLGLLFWEEIYTLDVPDVFRDPGQLLPLDWDTDHFYQARKEEIDARIEELKGMSSKQLGDLVEGIAQVYQDISSMVSWSYFTPSTLAELTECFQPLALITVLERMIKDHRAYRSGLPDLTVWDTNNKQCRLVEVKGPGDRLSTKQILWIRFLNSVGVHAEVCHVLATGSKGLQPTADQPTLLT